MKFAQSAIFFFKAFCTLFGDSFLPGGLGDGKDAATQENGYDNVYRLEENILGIEQPRAENDRRRGQSERKKNHEAVAHNVTDNREQNDERDDQEDIPLIVYLDERSVEEGSCDAVVGPSRRRIPVTLAAVPID